LGFGQEVKQRIMLGTFALSAGYYDAYYGKATAARQLIASEFAKAFREVDWLISPTAPNTAFKLGEKRHDPLAMYLSDICTVAVNLVGLPAISAPCGFDQQGLPIGMQIIGPAFSEGVLLQAVHAFDKIGRFSSSRNPEL
jgi:aspartyl-tRNA(Asn)/glutamyl-tRNA(Gln) amidotransferase subunit A